MRQGWTRTNNHPRFGGCSTKLSYLTLWFLHLPPSVLQLFPVTLNRNVRCIFLFTFAAYIFCVPPQAMFAYYSLRVKWELTLSTRSQNRTGSASMSLRYFTIKIIGWVLQQEQYLQVDETPIFVARRESPFLTIRY